MAIIPKADGIVSAAESSNWGTDYAAAIRDAIATGKHVLIPHVGVLTLNSSLGATAAGQVMRGLGKKATLLRKAFNGDIISLELGATLEDLGLQGDGANFTGGGVVVSTGSSSGTGFQSMTNVSITDTAGYCVEWTVASAGWGGTLLNVDVQRTGNSGYCLKMPSSETNGNRLLNSVFAGSGPLIDFGGAANVQLVGCSSGSATGAVAAWTMTTASAKIQILGGRFATAAGPTRLLGQNHTMVGVSMAGALLLGDGNVNSLVNSFIGLNDIVGSITDQSNCSSGNANSFDVPYQPYSVTWAAPTTPAIGNGSLNGAYSRSGQQVTVSVELSIGTTTNPGTGIWSFSLPFQASPRASTGMASMVDVSAGDSYLGAVRVDVNGTSVQIFCQLSASAQSTAPFTWAAGDSLRFTLTYLAE